MIKTSQNVSDILVSQALQVAAKARKMKNSGIDIVSMSLGEPDFDTPSSIKNAAIEAIKNNYSHYTPLAGLLSAREAVCTKLKRDNNLSYSTENIALTTGAKQGLFQSVLAILNPGDQVIIPTPVWMSYFSMCAYAKAEITKVETSKEEGFKLTPEALKSAIQANCKLLMINNPGNPSGAVYSRQELQGLVNVLVEHPNITIISDEIYEHLTYDTQHVSLAEFDEIKDRVVLINGVSKSFAMTGYRLGFVAANENFIQSFLKLQGLTTSAPNAIAQKAAEFAFNQPLDLIEPMLTEFKERRKLINQLIIDTPFMHPIPADGAFYAFPDISKAIGKTYKGVKINDADQLADILLEDGHVATVSGAGFNAPNNLRLSYATSRQNINQGLERIHNIFKQLQ